MQGLKGPQYQVTSEFSTGSVTRFNMLYGNTELVPVLQCGGIPSFNSDKVNRVTCLKLFSMGYFVKVEITSLFLAQP